MGLDVKFRMRTETPLTWDRLDAVEMVADMLPMDDEEYRALCDSLDAIEGADRLTTGSKHLAKLNGLLGLSDETPIEHTLCAASARIEKSKGEKAFLSGLGKSRGRQIVQITATPAAEIYSPSVYALCGDGSVWEFDCEGWSQLPAIPQGDDTTEGQS